MLSRSAFIEMLVMMRGKNKEIRDNEWAANLEGIREAAEKSKSVRGKRISDREADGIL